MRIVVVGGTGRVGSKLVGVLADRDVDVAVASRASGVDIVTGVGLAEALEGASVVVDASDPRALDEDAVLRFFRTSTTNLVRAEAGAGVNHHVVLSIVGVDHLDAGYFRAKVTQEHLAAQRPAASFTIVRATQFFEFIGTITDAATDGDTVRIPSVRIRPVAADDVATALANVALEPPVNGVVEIAGPEEFALDELIRRWLGANHDPRTVVAEAGRRYFGAHLDERSLLPSAHASRGTTTWEAWLGSTTWQPR